MGDALVKHLDNYGTQAAEAGSLGLRSRTLGQYTGTFWGTQASEPLGKPSCTRSRLWSKGTLGLGLQYRKHMAKTVRF